MKIIEKIKETFFKIKDYDRLEWDYIQVLCHATDSRMSKPNYDIQTIKCEIDDAQERIHYGIIKSDIKDIIDDNGSIEDIKNYLKLLNT